MKSSLHVHHLDEDRSNNIPGNLIVLCANCHHALHHGEWTLEGRVPTNKKAKNKRFGRSKFIEKYRKLVAENIVLTNENKSLKQEINEIQRYPEISVDLQRRSIILSVAFIGHHSYKLRDMYAYFMENVSGEEILNVNGEFGSYTQQLISTKMKEINELLNTPAPKQRQKRCNPELTGDTIAVIQEHYSTPTPGEMQETIRDKAII